MPPQEPRTFLNALLSRLRRAPRPDHQASGDAAAEELKRFLAALSDVRISQVDTAMPEPAVARKLLDLTIAQWTRLGEKDAVWACVGDDAFKQDTLSEDELAAFYDLGGRIVSQIGAFERRLGVDAGRGVCMDFGCGIGHKTRFLAARFSRVIAVDISPSELEFCERRMRAQGVDNVEYVLLKTPEDIAAAGAIDFFFSYRVLPSNPPPVQITLLEQAFRCLRPSGYCMFQTPDWVENYTFSAQAFLEDDKGNYVLHCLPVRDVLAVAGRCGMTMLDLSPEIIPTFFSSYTYFARKEARV